MKQKYIFLILIFLFLFAFVFSQNLLSVTVESNSNNLEIKNVNMIEGKESSNNETLPLKLILVDKSGVELSSKNFLISCSVAYSVIAGFPTPEGESDSVCSKDVYLPFVIGGEKIILIKNSSEVDSFNLSELCNNNKICESNETEWSCISDCPKGTNDGVCNPKEDGFCDPDCSRTADRDCYLDDDAVVKPVIDKNVNIGDENTPLKKNEETNSLWFVLPFVLIIGVIFIVVFLFILKKQQGEGFE